MRLVALVALAVLLAMPAGMTQTATDDCAAAGPAGCTQIPPASPVPLPVNSPVGTPVFYLYTAAASCAPSFTDACSGRPLKGAPLGVVGLLYEENGQLPGLQRHSQVLDGLHYDADTPLLL